METHSSTLTWKIPWTEKPGGLQSMGSQKVGHNSVTNTHIYKVVETRTIQSKYFPHFCLNSLSGIH